MKPSTKIPLFLIIALGLFWFSENFPFYTLFEPQSTGWILWVSYAKDLIQPFAFYFFICFIDELRTLAGINRTVLNGLSSSGNRNRLTGLLQRVRCDAPSRALIAFTIPTLLEISQIFYSIFIYRSQLLYMGNFDPWDIVMYALGVGLAMLVEKLIFSRSLTNAPASASFGR
jgi:hypothetical protein